MQFVGRKQELDEIQQAWKNAKKGSIELVLIAGEAGLGKTRLVSEFYHWLNQNDDTDDYWPDNLPSQPDSLLINPEFTHDPKAKLAPWLWWGIRWTQPNQRNTAESSRCAADADISKLEPHLEHIFKQLDYKKLEKEKTNKALLTAATTLFDTVIQGGFAGATATIYGLWQDYKKLSTERVFEKSITEIHSQKIESRLQKISSLLLNITRPNLLYPQGMPLILILDDIQFADVESLQFIQRLLRDIGRDAYAKDNHLPRILMIATTWEREWRTDQDAPLSKLASSAPHNFADMLRALQNEAQLESEKSTNTLIDAFKLPNLTTLNLKKVKGFELAIRAELPGLTDSQVKLVTERASGLPRLLEQIVLTLKSQPMLFMDRSIENALTTKGEEKVRNMNVEYHALLETRLGQMPPTQADILRLASYFGLIYSRPFAQALAKQALESMQENLTDAEIEAKLKSADNPLAIVQALSQHIDEFRLPVYQELLVNQLKSDETLWQCLDEKIPTLLCQWVQDTQLQQMREEEKSVFLSFANQELHTRLAQKSTQTHDKAANLIANTAEDVLVIQNALFKTISTQLVDAKAIGRIAPMQSLLSQWSACWQSIPKSILLLTYDELIAVYSCYSMCSQYQEVEKFCEAFLSEYEALEQSKPDDRRSSVCKRALVQSLYLQDAKRQQATDKAKLLLEQAKQALAMGETEQRLRDVAMAQINEAHLLPLSDEGKVEALELSEKSLAIFVSLLKQFGESEQSLRDVAVTQGRVAYHLLQLRDKGKAEAEAFELLCKALVTFLSLLEKFGKSEQRLQDVASVQGRVAALLPQSAEGKTAALKLSRDSLAIFVSLLKQFGESEQRLCDAALALQRVVGLLDLLPSAEGKEVLELSRYSLAIYDSLLERFGESEQRLQDVSLAKLRLSGVLAFLRPQSDKAKTESVELFRASLAIREALLAKFGESEQRLKDVASAHVHAVLICKEIETKLSALDYAQKGLEVAERLATKYPNSDGATLLNWFKQAMD